MKDRNEVINKEVSLADSFEELEKSSAYDTNKTLKYEVRIEDIYLQEMILDEGIEQILQDEQNLTPPIPLCDSIRNLKDG